MEGPVRELYMVTIGFASDLFEGSLGICRVEECTIGGQSQFTFHLIVNIQSFNHSIIQSLNHSIIQSFTHPIINSKISYNILLQLNSGLLQLNLKIVGSIMHYFIYY